MKLILGIDLANEEAQVCYYDAKINAPESVTFSEGAQIYKNPMPIKDILSANVDMADKIDNMTQLLSTLINSAVFDTENNDIAQICVVVEDYTIELLNLLMASFEKIGYPNRIIKLISYEESCAYYAYSMKRELWNGGVILFNYNSNGIKAYNLSDVKAGKNTVIVEKYKERQGKLSEEELLEFAKELMNGKVIASVYLTGNQFDMEALPEDFLKYICNRRRVFAGQNLFVKGACYCALELEEENVFDEMILACNNRITTGIEIEIAERGKKKILRVIKPGINWFSAKRSFDFIVDNCEAIVLNMVPVSGESVYEEIISLSEIPYRTKKNTRIRMTVEFTSAERCLITVKDKGFGEFEKSSGKVIYKNIEM